MDYNGKVIFLSPVIKYFGSSQVALYTLQIRVLWYGSEWINGGTMREWQKYRMKMRDNLPAHLVFEFMVTISIVVHSSSWEPLA